MERNVSSQYLTLFAFDFSTGAPKTGDQANLTPYVSVDDGTVTVLTNAGATQLDATNAPGMYKWLLTSGETNGTKLIFTCKSSTANVSIVPQVIYTTPPNFSLMKLDTSLALGYATVYAENHAGEHLLTNTYYDSYTRLTSGTVAAGAAGTVTLAAGASSVDDFYKGRAISIISGTGVGQTRVCTAYNGTTKVATISPNWATNPAAAATYYIGLLDASSVPQTGDCFARLTGTGAVTFASLDVSGATTLAGAVTASNASNDVRGIRISSGTGTGQLDVTSGRIKADTVYFGGSAGSFTTGVPSVNTTLISGSLVSTSTAQLGVNVVNFGGSAGTFSGGRPEVNASHWGGTAVASANVRANLIQIGGDTQSGTDLKDFVDTGYDPASHKVAGVVLVDTLTTYTGNTPQTGDAYAIVNSGTYGNSALKTEVLAIQSSLVTIFNDTDELQQDWTNGGRLDLLVDSIIATLGVAGAGLTAITGLITDIYHADIYYIRDDAGAEDVYKCVWMKNGIRITSGITSPTIQVVKEADGSNLIASSAMTEIGTTEAFKYTATTTARQTAGESCLVIVGATIDGSARTFVRSLGRDSTA